MVLFFIICYAIASQVFLIFKSICFIIFDLFIADIWYLFLMKSQSIHLDTICFTNLSHFTFVFRMFSFDSFMMFNFIDLANLMFIHIIFFNFDYSFYFNLNNCILFRLILIFKIKNIWLPYYFVILSEIGLLKMVL